MLLTISIPDEDYRQLLASGKRMQGTLGLINTTEATFNRHHHAGRARARDYRFLKLAHGRVSITDERIRLNLSIDRSEALQCAASDCIEQESLEAIDFVDGELG